MISERLNESIAVYSTGMRTTDRKLTTETYFEGMENFCKIPTIPHDELNLGFFR
jgi:hypothetical protein